MNRLMLSDGLGNQMFQYSFAKYLEEKGQRIECDYGYLIHYKAHNGYELDHAFINIEAKYSRFWLLFVRIYEFLFYKKKILMVQKIVSILGVKEVRCLEDYDFDNKKHQIIIGHWQSARLLPHNFSFIFREDKISKKTMSLAELIKRDSHSVSIHIRRGDYLSNYNQKVFGGICTIDYYYRAIKLITSKIIDPTFYVFSNDLDWVKDNIDIPNPIYVDFNMQEDSWQDMYLMSLCNHNIIANSTFSWWGAWLNKNPDKIIISPSRFTNYPVPNVEVIPAEWIRI